jgi:hypothetical protein
MFRLLASDAPPQSVTLAWSPSVSTDVVAGYFLYYGIAMGNYTGQIDAGLTMSAVVPNLQPGVTYFFATTAYTSSGEESGYSNEIVWQRPLLLNIQRVP